MDRSTKSHPELTGEGIEYSWGRSKPVYQRAMIAQKKGKENSHQPALDCPSTEDNPEKGGLTQEMVRKFSRRARQSILANFYIEHEMKEDIEEGLHEINIMRIKKDFKTHRSAIEFDKKFINYCFQKSDNEQKAAGSNKQQRAQEKEP